MDNGHGVGYFAIAPNPVESSAQLSEIYVKHGKQGRGLRKVIMIFAEEICIKMNI
jgi:hypothetical protein